MSSDAVRPTYSFVVPVFNEEATLGALYERLSAVLERLDGPSEVILVDDGSSDRSPELLRAVNARDPRFKVVVFSRNFGHQVAVSAGIDMTVGDAVVIIDADLQDPPEIVLEMAQRWREGWEVVYGVRRERAGESLFKLATASIFYRLLNRLTDVQMPLDVGDFRLIDRKAVEAFKLMPERNRYVRGMIAWIGFRQTGVEYMRAERYAGETKYPVKRMLKFAVNAIVGFSQLPLRIALALGFVVAGAAFAGGVAAVALKATGAYVVPGWASIVAVIGLLGGVQLMVMGMLGVYIGRMYEEVKRRPLYIVRETHGLARDAPTGRTAGSTTL